MIDEATKAIQEINNLAWNLFNKIAKKEVTEYKNKVKDALNKCFNHDLTYKGVIQIFPNATYHINGKNVEQLYNTLEIDNRNKELENRLKAEEELTNSFVKAYYLNEKAKNEKYETSIIIQTLRGGDKRICVSLYKINKIKLKEYYIKINPDEFYYKQ